MNIHRGIGVSDGIVFGKALTIYSAFLNYPRIQFQDEKKIAVEIERIQKSKAITEDQLTKIIKNTNDLIPEEIHSVFSGYKLFINDKRFIPVIEATITESNINAEWALIRVLADLEIQFSKIPDPYIRSRFDDIRQLGEHLMKNLLLKPSLSLSNLEEPVILISHDISPADTFNLNKENILGIVTEMGGDTSHVAILARAMNIPAVLGVPNITHQIIDDESLILDGSSGEVITQPDQEIIDLKLSKQERFRFYLSELEKLKSVKCQLKDGVDVNLAANLDFLEELNQIREWNIDSIGLIRTEFLFSYDDGFPTEDEQLKMYHHISETISYKPITIRTWDIGGDKTSSFFPELAHEANPALGLRAIRICLKHKDFYRTQIRAILRASEKSKIRIMIPMVTRLDEVITSKKMLDEEREKLNIKTDNVKLGCMVETPASVFIIDELLDLVDFISIGSNDLIQYALAVDRMNENVAGFYTPFHPSILKMLEKIIASANRVNKDVSICGEIAADPIMQMFLIGTGKITFSMSPNHVLRTKRILSKVDSTTCKKIAFQFVSKHSLEESNIFVQRLREQYMDEIELRSADLI